ncbi:MAG: TonB-dependent receptor [Bacteroidota bacterium]
MNKKIFLLIGQLIFCTAFAQQVKVMDIASLQPVSGVKITASQHGQNVTTDNQGKVDLSVFSDKDSLSFYHMSYQLFTILKSELLTKQNKKNTFDVYLSMKQVNLSETVFSVNRFQEKIEDVAGKIEVIQARNIAMLNPQTSGELIQATGNVFVQKSQHGGSSPVIRGFEANRVLLIVDGVRMNNAIYRSGHLQNIITLDPSSVERVEILYGPGSVIYGSDAIGGVMHFYTKKPELSLNDKMNTHVNLFSRYATADQEKSGGISLNFGKKKWASLTEFSYKDIENLRMGARRNPAYGEWGKCLYYPATFDNKDSVVLNSNPYVQKNTGYTQYDLMQKILYQPASDIQLILNLQYSNSSDVPRYDRLNLVTGSSTFSYAEWYYGPQQRLLSSLRAEINRKTKLYDNCNVTAAYQQIGEDRVQRKFGKSTREHREEDVAVYSLNVDMKKELFKNNEFSYGLEVLNNQVKSYAWAENFKTGETFENISSRYPDDGSQMTTGSAYVMHSWDKKGKMVFTQGIRYTWIQLDAAWSDTMMHIMDFNFDPKVKQQNQAISGNLGFVLMLKNDWRFTMLASTGFRAPNVDDVGKVNDSKSSAQQIVVPNTALKPENAYNGEMTFSKTFNKNVKVEVTGFYTLLEDAIVVKPYSYNGQDSMLYGGEMCKVFAPQNTREAYVCGIQSGLNAQVTKAFSMFSNLSYVYGYIISDQLPMDHIPPVYGMTSFKLELKKFRGEFYVRYNGWKRLEEYNQEGEDNLNQASVYGSPAWYTINAKVSFQINRYINLQAGVENILDVYYRQFASGISAPGRNCMLTLRAGF